jgi:hypothetical protein
MVQEKMKKRVVELQVVYMSWIFSWFFLDQNIIILTWDSKLKADESDDVGKICSLACCFFITTDEP